MGSKTLVLLVLVLLAAPASALAQSGGSTTPSIGLGYGPQSIEPADLGVPVFAQGDQIWIESFENTSSLYATLSTPGSAGGLTVPVVQGRYLGPGSLIHLYTFGSSDPLGTWTLDFFSAASGLSSSIGVTLANATSLVPTYEGGGVAGNDLKLSYSLPPTPAYDIQVCAMGASQTSSASFKLPGSIGGALDVDLAGEAAAVSAPIAVASFTGWLELYTERAYQSGGTLVSEETLAARSSGVFFLNGSTPSGVSFFTTDLNLRAGRYDLRAYVRTPSGLDSYDAPFLLLDGGSWVSLNGCTQLTGVSSGTFILTTNLDNPNATWPRLLYTMYTAEGVDGVTSSRIPASEARIDIRNSATAGPVPGIEIRAEGAGVQSWSGFDSGVYVIGAGYPLHVRVTLGFEGVVSESFNVTVLGPFEHVSMAVDAGTLVVHTSANGKPLANATVVVSPGTGGQASFVPGPEGNVTLTLPPGDYGVTASFSGRTGAGDGHVLPGGVSYVRIDLSSGGTPIVADLLAVVLIVGVGTDFLVWRAYLERRSA